MKFAEIIYIINIKLCIEGILDILRIIGFIIKNMAKNCNFLLSSESKISNIDNFLKNDWNKNPFYTIQDLAMLNLVKKEFLKYDNQ